ncbi:MAG: VOC family protein [Proteobacteria bacterium]|nr:VOC family protein [Pseudomonadota bacterium]
MSNPFSDYPQTPAGDQIFLDHVGWFVPDMDAAAAAIERLGFILTPFVAQTNADPAGGPPVPAGTGNRCAMLRRGYLEFLAAVLGADTPLSRQLDNALGRYQGVHLIAFTVDDAAAAHARLKREGFAPLDPVHLRRPLTLAAGNEAEVAFTVIRVPPEAMPEGRIQMLRQETPDLVWQESLIARDNGIAALAGVLLCVDDPAGTAARYECFTGRPSEGGEDYRVIALDRGRIGFASPLRAAVLLPGVDVPTTPFIAAVAFQADDPDVLRKLCEAEGIPLLPAEDGTVRVHPSATGGAALVICGDDPWPPAA